MANYNRVILIGNLTRDPEVRYTPSGTAVAELDMAINRNYKRSDGEMAEDTTYVNRITVWGRQAESCGKYLKRGMPVMVEGRLKYDTWEKDGQKHSRLGVVAERVQFLSGPSRSTEFHDGGAGAQTGRPVQGAATNSGNSGVQNIPPQEPAAVPASSPAKDELPGDDEDLPF